MVGENDSGKTAIIDAIRIVMGTTDQSWYRIEPTDFHQEQKDIDICISLKFSDLSQSEQAAFLECLSCETVNKEVKPCLYVNWKCKYLLNFQPSRISVSITTGSNGDGPALPVEARELLRVTYLRPLRDSYSNMQAGRNSRLSQIVQGIPNIEEGISEYTTGVKLEDLSISGIASLSNYLLANHSKLKEANAEIGTIMNSKMLLKGDEVETAFEVAGTNSPDSKRLISLLEKLDLTAHGDGASGKIGLGTSNILSMACELLLNRGAGSSFLLIEEPEAHVHAQRQLRLIQSLQAETATDNSNQQIIITTHSPLMASVVKLENISIVKGAKVYSLRKAKTKLEDGDYKFLERYLDATKANLFFAKSVMMVEGPSEELLIPTIAKLIGKDFTEYGVSVVNVRGIGLSRFARIFQRADSSEVPLEEKKYPVGIKDYYFAYDSEAGKLAYSPQYFVEFYVLGQYLFAQTGDYHPFIENIAAGLRKYVRQNTPINIPGTGNAFNMLIKAISEEKHNAFRTDLATLIKFSKVTNETWAVIVTSARAILKNYFDIESFNANFFRWIDVVELPQDNNLKQSHEKNVFFYQESERTIQVRLSSIHGVKGRTHLATLVLDTFWYDRNIKSILSWLCNGAL